MRPSLVLLALAGVLAFPSAAAAHVEPVGTLLAEGASTLRLTAHNDLDQPMTGLRATLPSGFTVVEAEVTGWSTEIAGETVTWIGELGAKESLAFDLALEGSVEPGPVSIDVEQLYSGAEPVRTPLELTAVPGAVDESAGGVDLRDVLLVAGLGLLSVAVVLLLRRHRSRSLQER